MKPYKQQSQPVLKDHHSLYSLFNIVLYSIPIVSVEQTDNTIQRHKVFSKLGMRSLLASTFYKEDRWNWGMNLRGYALDNGAWVAFQQGTPFPSDKFIAMITTLGHQADWIAIPDVVANRTATLKQANGWIKRIRAICPDTPLLFVWQDGMTRADLLPFIRDGIGIFVGGTTDAKLKALPMIGQVCHEYDVWSHCGRVNSPRRLKLCLDNYFRSCDGSSYGRFLYHAQYLYDLLHKDNRQHSLFALPTHDFSMLTTFDQRNSFFNIGVPEYDAMLNVNTDFIGLPNDRSKDDYPILRW